jgi:hypothetical protein
MFLGQKAPTKAGVDAFGYLITRASAFLLALAVMGPALASEKKQVMVVSVTGNCTVSMFGSAGSVVQREIEFQEQNQNLPLQKLDEDASLARFRCEAPPCERQSSGHLVTGCAIDVDPRREWRNGRGVPARCVSPVHREAIENPQRYTVAVSRGVKGAPVDAVLFLESGRLSAAFREMSAGGGSFEVAPIDAEPNAGAGTTGELKFQPKSAPFVDAGISAGLHRLPIPDDETGKPRGSGAWILEDGPGDYPADATAFQNRSEQASKWPQEMDPAAQRTWLGSLTKAKRGGRS